MSIQDVIDRIKSGEDVSNVFTEYTKYLDSSAVSIVQPGQELSFKVGALQTALQIVLTQFVPPPTPPTPTDQTI